MPDSSLTTGVDSSPGRAWLAENPPDRRRLLAFLLMHMVSFVALLFAIFEFARLGHCIFSVAPALAFLLSGTFCANAAWQVRLSVSRCLPLKDLPLWLGILLTVPYGWGQWVIVELAIEELRSTRTPQASLNDGGRATVNRFHCKAVNGMLEGFLTSATLTYFIWGIGFPDTDHPLTPVSCKSLEKLLLEAACCILFFGAGVGLLELDFCISEFVFGCFQRSIFLELRHLIFRTAEVWSRVALFVGFMVLTAKILGGHAALPLAVDFLVTLLLVFSYGGSEKNMSVRWLCSIPCMFANIFLFIDSPYKRRAARKLSRALTLRNFSEMVVLPIVALAVNPDLPDACLLLAEMHWKTTTLSALAFPVYWLLLWWYYGLLNDAKTDIFSACEDGDLDAVDDLTSRAFSLDINCCDVFGKTPLMLAVSRGHLEVCKRLIAEGASIDVREYEEDSLVEIGMLAPRRPCIRRRKWTALHFAAQRGNPEIVQALLRALGDHCQGSDQFLDASGNTPLHVAARSGHIRVIQFLADARPEWLTLANGCGQTPKERARWPEVRAALESVCGASFPRCTSAHSERAAPLISESGAQNSSNNREATDSSTCGIEEGPSWPQLRLPILRSNCPQNSLAAPGLCSFVASSSGGLLGRVFLVQTGDPRQMLATIDEGTPLPAHVESSVALDPEIHEAIATLRASLSSARADWLEELVTNMLALSALSPTLQEVLAAHGWTGTEFVEPPDRRSLLSDLYSRSALSRGSSFITVVSTNAEDNHPPQLADLVPIDTEGATAAWWREMVASTSFGADGMDGRSRCFINIPAEAQLGTGAYGMVWRAMDQRTGSRLAVKNIAVRRRAPQLALRDCQAADIVRVHPHPCLVRLHLVHFFPENSHYFLVMELCPNGNLQNIITTTRRECASRNVEYTPPSKAQGWLGQVFMGMEHVHLKVRALLRDVKAENVVLDHHSRAKITDFGFCRLSAESDGTWSFGMPPGTAGYVAPEVILRQPYDYLADMYSYGVLVWVILSGGLRQFEDPCPPQSAPSRQGDFSAFGEDWRKLCFCIQNPQYAAAQVSADVKDFLLKMIREKPSMRLDHDGVRNHAFMRPLRLPPPNARRPTVEAWLVSLDSS